MRIVACWCRQSRSAGRVDRRLRLVITVIRLIDAVRLIERIELLVVGLQVRVTKRTRQQMCVITSCFYRTYCFVVAYV